MNINAKILGVLGVMALMVAAWFFYKEDVKVKPALPSVPDVSYEVTDIKATQTNAQTGQTEYTLTAQSLVQNNQGEDEMVNAQLEWQPPKGEHFHIQAQRIGLNQQTGDMKLSQGFILTRKGNDQKADMVIQGEYLTGNTKNRTVQSNQPITVVQGEDTFDAQGFRANLQTGEYEFDKISLQFNPPKRADKPLF